MMFRITSKLMLGPKNVYIICEKMLRSVAKKRASDGAILIVRNVAWILFFYKRYVKSSMADPEHFDADPDPNFT